MKEENTLRPKDKSKLRKSSRITSRNVKPTKIERSIIIDININKSSPLHASLKRHLESYRIHYGWQRLSTKRKDRKRH
jgi:hypothetical protein